MDGLAKQLHSSTGRKFLLNDLPIYPDFILFELIERVQFISEGKLFVQYP